MAISHRLFFAIQPLKLQRIQIGHRRDELADVHRPVIDEDLHLTLAVTTIYDDFPTDVARTLRALGSAIMGEPAIISLERLAASQKSVALRPMRPSRELRTLQKALAEPMARKDLLLPGYKFSPHVTLGYRKDGKPSTSPIASIAWESQEFVLIHSEVGVAQHHLLGRWPLIWRQGRLF